jgi:hypothetical protein
MINALQLVVYIPLFTINFPSNAKMFYQFIVNLATFNVIPMAEIEDKIFNFTNSQEMNEKFD